MAKIKICSIEECGNKHYALGLCNKHYLRIRSHGTTDKPKRRLTEQQKYFLSLLHLEHRDECVIWPYGTTKDGYGIIGFDRKHHRVPCLLLEKLVGPRLDGHEAAHSCGVSGCCNPKHLRWATPKENCADKKRHGTDATFYVKFQGERLSIMDWGRKLGINHHSIRWRLRNGWCTECALTISAKIGNNYEMATCPHASKYKRTPRQPIAEPLTHDVLPPATVPIPTVNSADSDIGS